MADSDFSVKAIISAQTSQFEKGMKDAQKSLGDVSKSIQNVSNLLKSAFSVAGIALSVKAITDFGSSCVKAADEANKSFSILNNTINVTGATAWTSAEKMEQMSIEISDATNYSVGEIQDMQSVLLGFRNITGDTFREASDAITDMATVMGMDLKSAVQTVGKALDDPIKGLDSLKRQGFAFTEQQKEELAMLVKTGKQMEAQKIILDELNTTYGGAAKAAQSATARWNHAMDSLKESIGNQLMPAVNASTEQMTKIVTKITEFVNSSEFNKIVVVLANIANKVKEVFVVIGNYISEVFTEIMQIFNKVNFSPFKSVLDSLLGSVMKVVEIIKQRIDEGIKRFEAVANEIGNIVSSLDLEGISEYINAFIDGFWFIYDEVQKVTQEIQDWITEKIIWIWEKIKELFNNSNDALANSESSIKSWSDFFWKILDNVFRIFQDLINSIKAILHGDWKVAWEYAKLTVARVADNMLTIFSTIANAFPKLINGLIGGLNKLIEQINKFREWLGDDPLGLLESFTSVDLSEKSGLNEFIKETERNIENLTGKAADISIKNLKGISTESKGTFDKLKSEITSTTNLAKKSSNDSRKVYSKNLSDLDKDSSGFFESLNRGWQKVKEEIEKDANDWSDVIKASYTSMMDAGAEMFTMMGENLAGAGNSYEDFSATAVEALSSVLESLAAQLSATAALRAANYDYASAALAAAGAAAALVAAGTLAAVATNMTKTAEAARDASTSIDTFVKSLREIWSGTVTSGSFVTSLTTMKDTVTELREGIESTTESLEEQKELMDRLLVAKDMDFTERWEGYYAAEKNVAQLSKELEDLNTKLLLAQGELNNARMHTIENQEKEIEFAKAEISVFEELYNSLKKIPKAIYGDVKYALQQNFDILKNEQKKSLLDVQKSLYTDMSNMGKDLGKTLVDGIKNGTKTADFMESIKDYIRNKIIELTVYTESFNDKLAEIGAKLSSAIASGMTDDVKKLSGDIENLYKESTETARKAVEAMGLSLKEEVKNSSNNNDVKKEFSAEGTTLGETFITSLINGAKKEDFSKTLGSYMKEQLIRATVYTDAFKKQMDVFGKKLVESAGNKSVIKDLKKDIESLFSDKSKSIQNMTAYIDTLFELGEVATETESKFKTAMKSFKDSVMDLGGDIANNFVSSLSGGLNVDSALLGLKKFLRDYIIKAYVFTDSMKSEIENIGSLIGKTLDGSISKDELSNVANAVKATYGKLADSMKSVDTMLDSIFGKETIVENVSKIQKAIDNLKDSLKELGGDVAGNFISSLNSGLDLDSALISFKKFIRNYVIQSAVYTDSLKSEMEKIGKGIADYVSGKNKSTGLDKISNEFKKTYEKLASDISKTDEYLDKIFGKEKEKEVKDTGDTITKELSKIESAMDSFKKTVSDLGGDIASNLIDGLSNGLSQSDFLTNMKNWIKKMLVQSVVYTEQMKSQIEEIGKAISSAISGGFTETSMHEIRRDLSFIFEQATSKMSGIDKILGGVFDGYAIGTTSALSGLHIVGERGPELVRFNGGERVYNNADTMRMIAGAGKTNNFNVTFNNLQDTSAFAMMNQLKQYNREMAINGIL